MGFLRRLFGAKKASDGSDSKSKTDNKKRRWSFGKQSNSNKSLQPPPSALTPFQPSNSLDANKHAIAVAAATAAVAEAALAAAHAAAEVVRLTSGGATGSSSTTRGSRTTVHVGQSPLPEETAAVKIQSAFRSYLARRALRALKALVKLQALVRGHIVRKQTADMLRRMQTLVRLQTQARASRVHLSSDNNIVHSFNSSSLSHYPVPEKYEHSHRTHSTKFDGSSILKRCSSNANFRNMNDSERTTGLGSNWLDHWMELDAANLLKINNAHPYDDDDDDEKSDKILEVDTWKPQLINSMAYAYDESPSKRSTKSSCLKFQKGSTTTRSTVDNNSPKQPLSSGRTGNSTRKGPFTPTRSECTSWSLYGGYPNYMANTESSRAKVRSQSAPRQRLEFNDVRALYVDSNSTKVNKFQWDVGPNSEWDSDSRTKVSVSPAAASTRFNRIESTYLRTVQKKVPI